jgi:hypothetical protein
VSITVVDWSPPAAGWMGRLGPVPGLLRHRVRHRRRGRVEIQVALARPQPLYVVMAAALDVVSPQASQPAPVSTDVAAYGSTPPWLPASANVAGLVGRGPTDDVIRPYDALITEDGDGRFAGAAAVSSNQVLVDAAQANPRGYRPSRDAVTVDASADPIEVARIAMTGTVLHAPAGTPERLDPELRRILAEPLPDDDLDWEIRSVRQRRAALRGHATGLAMPAAIGVIPAAVRRPAVTALVLADDRLPTVLAALQAQTYPDLEIVVGASSPVDPAIAECSRPVQVVVGGLDALTARAGGALLTVIDSSSVYGPEHIWDLVLARHYSGATLAGKASEFVYLEPLDVTVRRTGLATEAFAATVSPGAALISRADVQSLGGWTDLAGRVRRAGGLVYRTHSFGYIDVRRSLSVADQLLKRSGPQWTGMLPEWSIALG